MYSDALYKGCLPNASDSVTTTLLAEKILPSKWGETRPITLSCTALKILAQLLLARGRTYLVDPHGVQWKADRGSHFRPEEVIPHGTRLGKAHFRSQTGHP